MGDKGAAYLRDTLKDVNCKLEVSHLIRSVLGDEGVAHLSDTTVKSRY